MLRSFVCLILLSLITTILTILVVITGLVTRSKRAAYRFIRIWAYALIVVFRVKVKRVNSEVVNFDTPVVYMSNHASLADIPVLMTAIPAGLAFISKRSLAWIPFLAWSMRAVGMVFITRSNTQHDLAVLNQAAQDLAPGMNFMVFPEGTRSKGDVRKLGPIKKGGFYLARSRGCAIQPVAVVGTDRIQARHSMAIYPGMVEVRFGAPIFVDDDSDINELMGQFQAQMNTLLKAPRGDE